MGGCEFQSNRKSNRVSNSAARGMLKRRGCIRSIADESLGRPHCLGEDIAASVDSRTSSIWKVFEPRRSESVNRSTPRVSSSCEKMAERLWHQELRDQNTSRMAPFRSYIRSSKFDDEYQISNLSSLAAAEHRFT
jgi:hypothetical protein